MAKMNVIKKEFTMLLPPAPGLCQECAIQHLPEEPHNRQSLYYQVKFQREHGRWPTWADAVAHCSPEVQEAWLAELGKLAEEETSGS